VDRVTTGELAGSGLKFTGAFAAPSIKAARRSDVRLSTDLFIQLIAILDGEAAEHASGRYELRLDVRDGMIVILAENPRRDLRASVPRLGTRYLHSAAQALAGHRRSLRRT